ncbi:MAG: threonine dehydratase [Gammaproteobacteria bacterium]|nr:threonine dehydratase [Gammaproteobacteria bacterium]
MAEFAARDLVAAPFELAELERAAQAVHEVLVPTPQLAWPLLAARLGCEAWVKHENHLPTGAFKVRGGLWFLACLQAAQPDCRGVVAATRGNHGQSIAFAAARLGLRAVIVVPHGNNPDKNRAMRALGAELVEAGEDFDAALAVAAQRAADEGLYALPSWHPVLVQGVASYALELFRGMPPPDVVYVPIGLGSGACGVIAARDALGLDCEVVGVVSVHADAYAQSFEQGQRVATTSADTLADGLAVRTPSVPALAYLQQGLARVVRVDDEAVLAAVRALLEDTHNLAEGAGAAPLAAALAERERNAGRRVALVLSGANLDRATLARALDLTLEEETRS